ncbi:MAG: fluoride efflux transporter CrcB [Methylococcaceae bacterium]|nr:fluoride efflux transporter CrcB [Methylococcaceae bacterium]
MSQLVAVAIGGAFGAVLRFLISSGVYHWLGRGFPYGTLAVNILGSLLIGLMTETLILQKIALSSEYRLAILVGLFGSLTTFSTFSLETLYLLEEGQLAKASYNVLISVIVCVFAVWIGLNLGKLLFSSSNGSIQWMGWVIPYALLIVNAFGALLIGIISTLLLSKASLSMEHSAALVIIVVGIFVTLSTVYLVHYFIEHDYSFSLYLKSISASVMSNLLICSLALWLGCWIGKQI